MRKILPKKLILYGVFLLTLFLSYSIYGQSIKRQCVSSYGSSSFVENVLVSQTVGQGYTTSSPNAITTIAFQGFIQPSSLTLDEVKTTTQNDFRFRVFPNPASKLITLQMSDITQCYSIEVFDINGKRILADKVSQISSYDLNCESWGNGVYLITIINANQKKQTAKVVISK